VSDTPRTDAAVSFDTKHKQGMNYYIELTNRTIKVSKELERELTTANEQIAELEKAVSFLSSCIKSGEQWTDTCEQVVDKALRNPDE